MRKIWLVVSILLSIIVLSFSLQSGEVSSELSGSLTASIHAILIDWFPSWNLGLDTLHWLVRKTAHVGSYFVLGVSWTHTLGWYQKSLRWVVFLGVLLATMGELLQLLADQRGPSLFDALIFNGIGYAIGALLYKMIISRVHSKRQDAS